jgi:hypothetical protein
MQCPTPLTDPATPLPTTSFQHLYDRKGKKYTLKFLRHENITNIYERTVYSVVVIF